MAELDDAGSATMVSTTSDQVAAGPLDSPDHTQFQAVGAKMGQVGKEVHEADRLSSPSPGCPHWAVILRKWLRWKRRAEEVGAPTILLNG